MKKSILIFSLLAILIGAGSFYGGMKYAESKIPSRQRFQNLTLQERQRFIQERTRTGFISGEVIAKDEKSLTIKMPDGSSKIIFFSDSTEVSKTIKGAIADIEIGKQVIVTGSQNTDGSYTAKTIQISPRYLPSRDIE